MRRFWKVLVTAVVPAVLLSMVLGTGPATRAPRLKPSHTYTAANTYSVSLTVTDTNGVPNTETQSVTVSAPPVSAIAFRGVAGIGRQGAVNASVTCRRRCRRVTGW